MDDDAGETSPPADPLHPLLANAVQLHELMTSYVEAGFTAEQAVYLTGVILATMLRQAPGAG